MADVQRDWMDKVDQLAREGVIDGDDQNALIRHLDEHRREFDAELRKLVPEYERRVATDGQAGADEWLAATARALGERDGMKTRRLLDSLSTARSAPAA